MITFAISERPVNLHHFARLFRDQVGCRNALYLDGTMSSLYAPAIERADRDPTDGADDSAPIAAPEGGLSVEQAGDGGFRSRPRDGFTHQAVESTDADIARYLHRFRRHDEISDYQFLQLRIGMRETAPPESTPWVMKA